MKSRHHFLGNLPVILLACSLLAAPAQAQQTTSRVVFVGDDASGNPVFGSRTGHPREQAS